MKVLEYRLFPEAYGGNGTFMDKKGSAGNLVTDMGLLVNSDFDKVIPSMEILNGLFLEGGYGRNGEWEPFELNENEYIELVEYLLSLPLNKKYRIEN